jgi:hypothetical protein
MIHVPHETYPIHLYQQGWHSPLGATYFASPSPRLFAAMEKACAAALAAQLHSLLCRRY